MALGWPDNVPTGATIDADYIELLSVITNLLARPTMRLFEAASTELADSCWPTVPAHYAMLIKRNGGMSLIEEHCSHCPSQHLHRCRHTQLPVN